MRLLLDQDVFAITGRFLRDSGHDAVTAADLGSSRTSDSDLLRTDHAEGRILVTRDRDFGGLVYLKGLGAGGVYLRILPSTINAVQLNC
jgi:predicted nuclease of predicted toxin-antitoxin system